MEAMFDPEPLCEYVTTEISPLRLVQCINELTIDYLYLMLSDLQKEQPTVDITQSTYDGLFELHRLNHSLLEGVIRKQQEQEEEQQKKRMLNPKRRVLNSEPIPEKSPL
ncbi:MAG: hypothetical protein LIP08_03785 [Bacteroides sp.]|nr:hypothetical protein [Bacteroides sp.]